MNKLSNIGTSKGFTIVELIVVIAIIGILAGIVTVSYSGSQNRANKSAYQATAQQVKLKLGDYFTDNNKYPTQKGSTSADGSVMKYLSDTSGGTAANIVTEFTKAAYVYQALPSGCDNSTTACTGYSITVAKSNWNGGASDSDVVVGP